MERRILLYKDPLLGADAGAARCMGSTSTPPTPPRTAQQPPAGSTGTMATIIGRDAVALEIVRAVRAPVKPSAQDGIRWH